VPVSPARKPSVLVQHLYQRRLGQDVSGPDLVDHADQPDLAGGIAIEDARLEKFFRGRPHGGRQGLAHGQDAADARKLDAPALAMTADGIEIIGIDHQAVRLEFRQEPDLLGNVDIGGIALGGRSRTAGSGCPQWGPPTS
jgi:hypothetical protein